MLVIITF